MNEKSKYSDIISLPHHVSTGRKHMSVYDRAAQFSPFAALTGHDEALKETARLTDSRPELDDSEKQIIGEKLQMILYSMPHETEVSITHFEPDSKKSGGAYIISEGIIKKYDELTKQIRFSDGSLIDINSIVGIEIL